MVLNRFMSDRLWKQAAEATGLRYGKRSFPTWENGRKQTLWTFELSGQLNGVRRASRPADRSRSS